MEPRVGSYSIQFDATQTLAQLQYPTDGRGGWAEEVIAGSVRDDSFVRTATECVITSVKSPANAGGVMAIQIYHEDGQLAFKSWDNVSTRGPEFYDWPPDGLLVTGSWYVRFAGMTSTSSFWNVAFKIVTR